MNPLTPPLPPPPVSNCRLAPFPPIDFVGSLSFVIIVTFRATTTTPFVTSFPTLIGNADRCRRLLLAVNANGREFLRSYATSNFWGVFSKCLTCLFIGPLVSHVFPAKMPRGPWPSLFCSFQKSSTPLSDYPVHNCDKTSETFFKKTTATGISQSLFLDLLNELGGYLRLVAPATGNVGGLVFGH